MRPARCRLAPLVFTGVALAGCATRDAVAPAEPAPASAHGAALQSGPLAGGQSALPDLHTASEDDHVGGRGWLGVELEATGPREPGVRIRAVVPTSPADAAGVRPGDVVLTIEGELVTVPDEVITAIGRRRPGERVGLVVRRGHSDRLLSATLKGKPERNQIFRLSVVDRPAPALEDLKTVQGSLPPSLGALRGKVVVLEFWATWCVVCPVLVPVLNRWHDQFAGQGVHVIGITVDPVSHATAAVGDQAMRYSVFSDESGKTTVAYRANALPMVFVIDKAGRVADVMVGYDPAHLARLELLVGRLVSQG